MSLKTWAERKIGMEIIEKLLAQLIERTCKNYVTSIIGGLVILGATLGGVAGAISDNLLLYGIHVQATVLAIAAIATGVALILAKDTGTKLPGVARQQVSGSASQQIKLGAWMLIAVLLMGTTTGCSGVTVAQDIVNWTPALESAVSVVDSTASVLDPAAAPIFAAATVGFDTASNLLVAAAKTYLANPSASALQQLQAQVVALQQQVNSALLKVVGIKNPASQQKAQADVNAVATVINAILALVLSISSKAAAATMATAAHVKLAQIEPYIDRATAAQTLAAHYKDAAGFPDSMTSGTFGAGSEALSVGIVNLEQAGF